MMNNTIQNTAYYTIKEYNNIHNTLNITILMLNIRSFNKNINTFNIFLDTLVSKPDIIVLTETWLTDTDDPSIYLTDYKMFKTNRILKIKKKGGGVAIFAHKHLDCLYIEDLSTAIDDDLEIISIQLNLKFKYKPIIITGLYKAPNINRTIFNDFFYNLFLKYINSEIFICGDFNIDFLDVFNPFTIDFNNTISQLGLNNLIKIPTRLSTYKNSLIDNILTNSNSILLNGVINTDISDHSVIFTTLNIKNNYTKSCDYVYIRNMHNINALVNTLSIYKWDYFYTITDPSICYDELVIQLNEMFNKFCPISRKKINKNSINNPWLTSKLKNAIRKKNKLFNTYKTKNCPITFIKYKKLKNKINKI